MRLHSPEQVKLALQKYHAYGEQHVVAEPIVVQEGKKEEEKVAEEKKEVQVQAITAIQDCYITVSAADGRQIHLGMVKKGETIPYIRMDGDWYQVQKDGKTGYIHKEYCIGSPN
jgi:uncharacterized protein YgiM (DUF1202 family)